MHLIGGLLVGLCALSPWAVIYSVIIAVSCLELKDKLHGCPWDWLDWACRVQPRFNKVKSSTPEGGDRGQVHVPKSNKVQRISGHPPVLFFS